MGYDWADDAKKCYNLAVKVKRERGDNYWPERKDNGATRKSASEPNYPCII